MTKLFIVDNQGLMRKSLVTILNAEDDMIVVGEAKCGNDAIEQLLDKHFHCDIVLMEIVLPDIKWDNLIKKILEIKPQQKILVLSNHSEEKFALRTLSFGAAGYMCKDTSVAELKFAIRKIGVKGRYLSPYLVEQLAYDVVIKDSLPHLVLSNIEFKTMIMLAKGLEIKEIASKFALSINSILSHKVRIYNKMKMKNNVELTWYAYENNLIECVYS